MKSVRVKQMKARLSEHLRAVETVETTRARQPKGDWHWKAKGMGLQAGAAEALLDDLRADGAGA